MVTRVSAPVTGATNRGPYLPAGKTEVSFVYRTFEATRHFKDQDVEQIPPGPSVDLQTYDLSITHALSKRNTLTLSIPVVEGEFNRAFPLGGPGARSISETSGVGDIAVTWRKWLHDPALSPTQNLRLGVGVKFPTGDTTQGNLRAVNLGTAARPVVAVRRGNADTSIQPGDGGYGLIVGFDGFRKVADDVFLYGEGTYLANPRNTNDLNNQEFGPGPYVPNRSTSVPDYFLGRLGFAFPRPFDIRNLSLQSGLRIEGQPVRDIIGGDAGFRRPGYSLAAEPGLAYSFGRSNLFLSVPITIRRRRWLSRDEELAGRLSAVSAAFANYNVLVGLSHRF